jgi:hypothetical protein
MPKEKLEKDVVYQGSTLKKPCPKCKGRRYKDTKGGDLCLDCGYNFSEAASRGL